MCKFNHVFKILHACRSSNAAAWLPCSKCTCPLRMSANPRNAAAESARMGLTALLGYEHKGNRLETSKLYVDTLALPSHTMTMMYCGCTSHVWSGAVLTRSEGRETGMLSTYLGIILCDHAFGEDPCHCVAGGSGRRHREPGVARELEQYRPRSLVQVNPHIITWVGSYKIPITQKGGPQEECSISSCVGAPYNSMFGVCPLREYETVLMR